MPDQPRHDVHLYLVSTHATPNVTPALDETTRPREVVLLVSPEMEDRATWLESVLHRAGLGVTRWPIKAAWDIEHIRERVTALLRDYGERSIALNATGGSKAMSIAAFDVFRADHRPVFYVHPEKDLLVWMYPQNIPHHHLADRIGIRRFVEVYGGQVTAMKVRQADKRRLAFAGDVIAEIDYFSKAIGTLNYLAGSAERDLRSRELDQNARQDQALGELLRRLEALNILEHRDKRLHFTGEEQRFFANGGWLEDYVFATVNGLKKTFPALQDSAMSVQVVRGDSVKNEIDVAFLLDNKLHLIECKAKKFARRDGGDGTDTLYKIDSLSGLFGGVETRSMLVSYKKLGQHDLQRAAEMQVEVVHYKALADLEPTLRQWIEGRSGVQ
ncbi:MAG: DUF1887 family protein [Gammaproteobacteria bacterium]|nr:DUF1887 family protein [Gammaproteobacteria bacterium]